MKLNKAHIKNSPLHFEVISSYESSSDDDIDNEFPFVRHKIKDIVQPRPNLNKIATDDLLNNNVEKRAKAKENIQILQEFLDKQSAKINGNAAVTGVKKRTSLYDGGFMSSSSPVDTSPPLSPMTTSILSSPPVNYGKITKSLDFTSVSYWKKEFVIARPRLDNPIGCCLLKNGMLVVASKGQDMVTMFRQDDGSFVKNLSCQRRDFDKPSDMVSLQDGDFAIRENGKVMVFSEDGRYLRTIWEKKSSMNVYGLARDNENNIACIMETTRDRFIRGLNPKNGNQSYSIDLENVIKDRRSSKCRFLTFHQGKFYITDLGLNKVYILDKDTKNTEVLDRSRLGPEPFNDPAGVVVDNMGNIIVADSRNSRLCLFNSTLKYIGDVKLSPISVRRPSSLLYDDERKELYVLCLHGNFSVIKYSPVMK